VNYVIFFTLLWRLGGRSIHSELGMCLAWHGFAILSVTMWWNWVVGGRPWVLCQSCFRQFCAVWRCDDQSIMFVWSVELWSNLINTLFCCSVAQAYVNQKKLDTETKILHANVTHFAKQTTLWLKLVEDFNQALKVSCFLHYWYLCYLYLRCVSKRDPDIIDCNFKKD